MPPASVLDSSPKRVFAHYFAQFPISMDNLPADRDYYTAHYLNPNGENGKHRAYGGFLRQRPLPRPPLGADWFAADARTDVARASAAGIDGFTYDLFGASGMWWDRLDIMLDAARQVDPQFRVVLMPDMNTGVPVDQVALANAVAARANHPNIQKLPDGRLVVAPFLAERVGAAWWQQWMALMAQRGVSVALVPTMVDFSAANVNAFAPISYGMSAWGGRSPNSVRGLDTVAGQMRARGLVWMQPVAPQDVRPVSAVYDEAANTELMRSMWTQARSGGADWVQLVTWNDYSEGAEISPSTNTGWSILDLTAWHVAAFKTGVEPAVLADHLYVSHRGHPVAARPTGGQTVLMNLRPGSTPARDTVEVLTYLRATTTVTVQVGGTTHRYDAPAGIHARLFPLAVGTVSASTSTGATVRSPHQVVAAPVVQDLAYRYASSWRGGG